MKTRRFIKQSEVAAPVERVFALHERPDALEILTPQCANMVVVQRPTNGLQIGSQVILKISMGPFSIKWLAEHTEYEQNRMFADAQKKGPFKYWYHRHLFRPITSDKTLMTDEIEYALPFGFVGDLFGNWIAKKQLETMFDYRHRIVAEKMRENL